MAGEGTLEHATALFDPLPVEILFLAPLEKLQRRELPRAGCGSNRQTELLSLSCDGRGAEHVSTGRLGADDHRICQSHASLHSGNLGSLHCTAGLIPVRHSGQNRHVTGPGRGPPGIGRPDAETVGVAISGPHSCWPLLERLNAHRGHPVAQKPARPAPGSAKTSADHPYDGEQGHAEQPADRRDGNGAEHNGGSGDADDPREPAAGAGTDDATCAPELAPGCRGPR